VTLSLRTKILGLFAAIALSLTMVGPAMAASETVQITATNRQILSLSISQTTFAFGGIAPDGSANDSGTYRTKDGAGAYYCVENISAKVIANSNWTLSANAGVVAANGMDFSNLGGTMLNGCASTPGQVTWGPQSVGPFTPSFGSGQTGPNGVGVAGDLWVRSLWEDAPGNFTATINLTLSAS
jgi:hypothetical protein